MAASLPLFCQSQTTMALDAPQDEFEKFVWRMNPPSLEVDNNSSEAFTLFKVNSSDRHGILLEVVQILTDLDLRIRKAYISSDGGWFMDVFHVTDASGNKVTDENTLSKIKKSVKESHEYGVGRVGMLQSATADMAECTVIELTGMDRQGLMSEITALLAEMCCNVVAAELWTHNKRVACLLHVTEQTSGGGPISDSDKLLRICESLSILLTGGSVDPKAAARTDLTFGVTHTERRLHQMMFAGRDYENVSSADDDWDMNGRITVESCDEKGYSIVQIECRNRAKLVFDVVCTLIDMEYVVFHATIDSDGLKAQQEYYIRHIDGRMLNSDAERKRVVQCLRAAIERRVPEGLRLELCTSDRVGLLSDVTRILREHGLSVTRADVSTSGSLATNVFYVMGSSGNQVDLKVIEAVRMELMGQVVLRVSDAPLYYSSLPLSSSSLMSLSSPSLQDAAVQSKFSLVSLLGRPTQVLYNLGLIKSLF